MPSPWPHILTLASSLLLLGSCQTPRADAEGSADHPPGRISVAFRNRWRRHRVPDASMREDIIPKNILMIGESATARPSLM